MENEPLKPKDQFTLDGVLLARALMPGVRARAYHRKSAAARALKKAVQVKPVNLKEMF
jgi:hypothetical protein